MGQLKQPDIHIIGIPKEDKGQKNIWRSNGSPQMFEFYKNYIPADSKSSTKFKHKKHKEK